MDKTTLGIRLSKELKEKATMKAANENKTLSAVIVDMLSKWCNDKCEEGNAISYNAGQLLADFKIPSQKVVYRNEQFAQITFRISKAIKKEVTELAKNQNTSFTIVIRQLLYAWMNSVKKDSALGKIKMMSRTYNEEEKVHAIIKVSLGSKKYIKNELDKRSNSISQLINTLINLWLIANKHELPAEETLQCSDISSSLA